MWLLVSPVILLSWVVVAQSYALPTESYHIDATSDDLVDSEKLVTGWSPEVYDTFMRLAHWSQISYCTVLNPHFTEGPLPESCPKISFCNEMENARVVEILRPNLKQGMISGTAVIAVDDDMKQVIVIFRGSMSIGDWTTDFIFDQCRYVPILGNDFFQTEPFRALGNSSDINAMFNDENIEYDLCTDCKVHCGVYYAYSNLILKIEEAIKPCVDEGYQLVVTGHSLGGGYGYLAGIDFLLAGYNPLVVTFSSLRIGSPSWNGFVDENFNTKKNKFIVAQGGDLPIPSFTRVYQKTDLVPRLPPEFKFFPEYTHSGLEFVIDKVSLPQKQSDIEFRGKSDNYANTPFEFDLSNLRSATEAYQHINTLVRMSPPCSDFDLPL